MSYLVAVPDMLAAATTDLAGIRSTLTAADSAAAGQTTGLLAAGADEVSEVAAALFSSHGQAYQALSTEATTFHEQFVQALASAEQLYDSAEAGNASPTPGARPTSSRWHITTPRGSVGTPRPVDRCPVRRATAPPPATSTPRAGASRSRPPRPSHLVVCPVIN